MRHVLYSLFLEDCLEKLDTKYQNVIKDEMDDLFLYANIIEFPIYYKPFSRKNNPDYKIFEKLHTQKHLDVIEYIKTQIIEDNYNPKSLLFLYGFISHIVFDFYLESYISNILTINKIKKTTKNYSMVSANIEANFYYERTNKKIKVKK